VRNNIYEGEFKLCLLALILHYLHSVLKLNHVRFSVYFRKLFQYNKNTTFLIMVIYFYFLYHTLPEKMTSERLKKVIETVTRLQNFERRMCQMEVDETEFAYLKFLALFCPGEACLKCVVFMSSH